MSPATVHQLHLGNLTWLDLREPDASTLTRLGKAHGFHELDIEDCLSETQRAKMDEYDQYLFIILYIPYYDKRHERVLSEEVDIFIKNNLLVTVHWGALKVLTDLFESVKKNAAFKKEHMGEGSGFLLYKILGRLFESNFPLLDTIEQDLKDMERDVFSLNQQHDMLKDILNVKKNIITFRRVIAPQRAVVAQIEHKNKKFLPERLEIYFDDVVDKVEKIWAMLENHKELIESLQDTNESIISHTTNNVIKTLTIFSVVMLPLTFLTGLYGMNVGLPGAEAGQTFWVLLGVMTSVVMSMLLFFRFKRWI